MLEHVSNNGNSSHQRFAYVIQAFVDEAVEELRDAPQEEAEMWFRKLGDMLHWISSGEVGGIPTDDVPLVPMPQKALESAETR